MRRMGIMLLLGCLLAATLTSEACLAKNNFLESLSLQEVASVTIFDRPLLPTSTNHFLRCQSEFNVHGSCCEEYELFNLHRYEKETSDYNIAKMGNLVHAIACEFTKSGLMKKPQREVKSLAKHKFLKKTNKCWNTVYKLRGSALCAACSGQSQHYFTEDKDKILISPKTCSSVINDCEGFTLQIEKLENLFSKIKILANEQGKQDLLKNFEELYQKLKQFFPPTELMQSFMAYQKLKSAPQDSQAEAGKVCSLLVNLRHKPFIVVEDAESVYRTKLAQINEKHSEYQKKMTYIHTFYKKEIDKIVAQKEAELDVVRKEHSQNSKSIQQGHKKDIKTQINLLQAELGTFKQKCGEIKAKYDPLVAALLGKKLKEIRSLERSNFKAAMDYNKDKLVILKEKLGNKEKEKEEMIKIKSSRMLSRELNFGDAQQLERSLIPDTSVLIFMENPAEAPTQLADYCTVESFSSSKIPMNNTLHFT